MTDKELLVYAANAVGIEHPPGDHSIHNDGRIWDCNSLCWWNPLTDDGDALRLAVKLHMDITLQLSFVEAWGTGKVGKQFRLREEHNNIDPQAATRRAIVRAAAEIGKEQA